MPTTERADAFAKLVASRLNEITRKLNEAHADLLFGGNDAKNRHAQIQTEWDGAFRDFELATDSFSATVKRLHDEVEASRTQNPSESEGFKIRTTPPP